MPLMRVSSGRLWNRASRWGVPPVGTCGIERLDGEWLALRWCAATCVSNGCSWNRVSSPVMMFCNDTDVCLERLLVHFGADHIALCPTPKTTVRLLGVSNPRDYRETCLCWLKPSLPTRPPPPRFLRLRFACGGGFVSGFFQGG